MPRAYDDYEYYEEPEHKSDVNSCYCTNNSICTICAREY